MTQGWPYACSQTLPWSVWCARCVTKFQLGWQGAKGWMGFWLCLQGLIHSIQLPKKHCRQQLLAGGSERLPPNSPFLNRSQRSDRNSIWQGWRPLDVVFGLTSVFLLMYQWPIANELLMQMGLQPSSLVVRFVNTLLWEGGRMNLQLGGLPQMYRDTCRGSLLS